MRAAITDKDQGKLPCRNYVWSPQGPLHVLALTLQIRIHEQRVAADALSTKQIAIQNHHLTASATALNRLKCELHRVFRHNGTR